MPKDNTTDALADDLRNQFSDDGWGDDDPRLLPSIERELRRLSGENEGLRSAKWSQSPVSVALKAELDAANKRVDTLQELATQHIVARDKLRDEVIAAEARAEKAEADNDRLKAELARSENAHKVDMIEIKRLRANSKPPE